MKRIGFIGTGHIAAPMARALARAGHSVTVSERNAETAGALARADLGIAVRPNQQVLDASEVVFLCLRPTIWEDVAASLTWSPAQKIVSVMAGVGLDALRAVCAPVTEISSTIPYGFIEDGGCPLPVAGNPEAMQTLFGVQNPVMPVAHESQLIHYFAASSLMSGVLGLLEVTSGWLGRHTGDSAAAELYTSSLAGGFLWHGSFQETGALARAKWDLATPGTLNRQMVEGLEGVGAFEGLPALLDRIAASMEPDDDH